MTKQEREASEREAIRDGAATIFWSLAWANHVDHAGCYSLAGKRIEQHAPPIPRLAYDFAEKLMQEYERSNDDAPIVDLLARARKADGLDEGLDTRYAERFGQCLAYEAQGHGVAWTDDHEPYYHVRIYIGDETHCDLMYHAEEFCEHCVRLGRK